MTESMIERVKTAIQAEAAKFAIYIGDEEDVLRYAQAAIEAMREPTGQMKDAYMQVFSSARRIEPCEVYHAMIDAALTWPPGSADRAGVPMAEE